MTTAIFNGYIRPTGPPPVNTVAPALTDTTPVFGDTLGCTSDGTWSNSPAAFDYLWYSDGAPNGVTTASYSVTSADLGTQLKRRTIARNAQGDSVPVFSDESDPVEGNFVKIYSGGTLPLTGTLGSFTVSGGTLELRNSDTEIWGQASITGLTMAPTGFDGDFDLHLLTLLTYLEIQGGTGGSTVNALASLNITGLSALSQLYAGACGFSAAQVDALLATLVASGVTGGLALGLGGGVNGNLPPTVAGRADRDTLVAAGNSVGIIAGVREKTQFDFSGIDGASLVRGSTGAYIYALTICTDASAWTVPGTTIVEHGVWFRVDGVETVPTFPGGTGASFVVDVASTDDDSAVAAAFAAAVTSYFSFLVYPAGVTVGVSGTVVTIEDKWVGGRNDATDGGTSVAITLLQDGSNAT